MPGFSMVKTYLKLPCAVLTSTSTLPDGSVILKVIFSFVRVGFNEPDMVTFSASEALYLLAEIDIEDAFFGAGVGGGDGGGVGGGGGGGAGALTEKEQLAEPPEYVATILYVPVSQSLLNLKLKEKLPPSSS